MAADPEMVGRPCAYLVEGASAGIADIAYRWPNDRRRTEERPAVSVFDVSAERNTAVLGIVDLVTETKRLRGDPG